jgi:L-tryptophan--pyruvate aminotransferase
MYEQYWQHAGEQTTVVIRGWQHMSYFSDVSNICWFLEPELAKEIVRVHRVVGNAVTEGRHIIVGTGSSQLFLAALFALAPRDGPEPVSVVSQAPYYSVSALSLSLSISLHIYIYDIVRESKQREVYSQ